MTDTEETICRLCLAKLDFDCEIIDDAKKNSFHSLLLELNLSITKDPAVCRRCARNLEHASEFKTTCLQTEEIIAAFGALSDNDTFDLKEIYLSENASSNLQSSQDCVCRFCLTCVKKKSCLSLDILKENMIVVRDMLPKCLPELDFSLTLQPAICSSCIKSMERYFTFFKICSEVERKINGYYHSLETTPDDKIQLSDLVQLISKDLMGNSSLDGYIRSALTKVTKSDEDFPFIDRSQDVDIEIKEFLRMEQGLDTKTEGNTVEDKQIEVDSLEKDIVLTKDPPITATKTRQKARTKTKRKSSSKIPLKSNTKRKGLLALHVCLSQNKYNCEECVLTTKNKIEIKQINKLLPLYKCEKCNYQTKEETEYESHKSTHKEEVSYKCDSCSYETYREKNFQMHKQTHKQVEYKCKLCPFIAKRKNHLAVHALSHNPDRMYKCDLCSYETRRKNLLLAHMRVHRESKVELLKCVLCPYETKQKSSLRRHMENHSKVAAKPNAVAQDLMIIKEGNALRLVRKNDEPK